MRVCKDRFGTVVGLVALALLCAQPQSGQAAPIQLITNGGFETGNFTGWTVSNQANGSGNFFVVSGTTAPQSGLPTVGPASGNFYALSDQTGPGTHVITQSFTVAPGAANVTLSFDMFVNDWDGGPFIGTLDYTDGPREFGTADLLTGNASPFTTTAGVLHNFFAGADQPLSGTSGQPHGYTHYSFDITSLVAAGGTFQIRFGEADNQSFFNQGVDNVSVLETVAVPEPASLALLGLGAAGLAGWCRRRRRAA